ncbi:MAG: helix-turn-helix domain-containing protein [Spirochaetaceae bacterium]|jgi:transcriptional regulator with XRE-family HTH domain|nr:helix-turn-helix domain-containing protein [Spirochaetaceae bacterium]
MSLEKLVVDNIRRIRKEKGITQEKLAEACDTATSYIGLMEIYRHAPKLSTIENIANALNIDPIVLFQNPRPPSDTIPDAEISRLKASIHGAVEREFEHFLRSFPSK